MERSRIAGLWFAALFVACGPGGGGGGEIGNLDVPGQDRVDAAGGDSHDPGSGTEIMDDFGSPGDPGQEAAGDPGQDVVAPGACSKELNPACEPKDCEMGDGTAGKCAKDANGECACVREEPPQDPCGPDLNPQCEPRKCPIAPNVDGLCALDPATGQCTCGGGAVEDPCAAALNPECKPEACKLLDGTEGKCLKDFQGLCGCLPVEPGVDPCDEATLNPNCVPRECDDGKPETSYDRCRWVVIEVGGAPLDTCQCAGDTMPADPCDWLFNPECKPADCKLATGEVGKCQKDEKVGCSCQPEVVPVDPCGPDLNPNCEPKECPLPDGGVGTCRMDAAGACGCAPFLPPQDPCGKEQNPECKPASCDDGNPLTQNDQCQWVKDPVGLAYCGCVGQFIVEDPCSPLLNPECKSTECRMPTGAPGKCEPDLLFGCSCAPVQAEDPCSFALNPKCEAVACDDGDPATEKDSCRWVISPIGLQTCACQGQPVVFDPCDLFFNPACKPEACTTENGAPGKCGWTVNNGCDCVGSTTQCTTDKDCLVLDWLVDCVGHWDCLDGQCQAVCGKPCGDGFCDATEGEGPQSCPVDCQKCTDNTECSKTEYCAKVNGDCSGTGQCEPRPTLCPLVFKPVCGCDGVTYVNSCEAHHAGVNVLHDGACDS